LTRHSLLEGWQSYRREVVPAAASDAQVEECRLAFYAGAHAMLFRIIAALKAGEATGVREMRDLDDELHAFAQDMDARHGMGRA